MGRYSGAVVGDKAHVMREYWLIVTTVQHLPQAYEDNVHLILIACSQTFLPQEVAKRILAE